MMENSVCESYCTLYSPTYLFTMGDRLLLYILAEWTILRNMEGGCTRTSGIQLVAILTTESIQARTEKWNASRRSERRICLQSRQSNKAAHWFCWESWTSNRGSAHKFFTTFSSSHPFKYSSDREKMKDPSLFHARCAGHDCSPKFLFHALLSWHLVVNINLSKFDGWNKIWLWASIEARFAMPWTKIHAASNVRFVVLCHLFCLGLEAQTRKELIISLICWEPNPINTKPDMIIDSKAISMK